MRTLWVGLCAAGLAQAALCGAELKTWVAAEREVFATASLENALVHPDSMVVLARLDEDVNLALGRTVVDDFGKNVPLTDGEVGAGKREWLSGTPNVYGRYFTVDLGLDRAITRVRVLAGGSALTQPEYFMRGYRIEAATQRDPDLWHLLAEEPANFLLNVDTTRDTTWISLDEQGDPAPKVGRFLRLTLTRQDRSNWVSLGEIEAYGVGFVESGRVVGEFAAPAPVNVGRVRWQAEVPRGTRVRMRFRGASEGTEWAAWEEVLFADESELYAGPEPVDRFQYRGDLSTSAPFSTPLLRRVEVDYDPRRVAADVRARVAPDTVRKAVEMPLVYTAAVELGADDYGIDLLRLQGLPLEIDAVRVDGVELGRDETLGQGYRWHGRPETGETVIELAPGERLVRTGRVEIDARGIFLQDRTAIELAVGSREQTERDGFVNWQNGRQAADGAWTVRALGGPPSLVSDVEVEPRPFSPFAAPVVNFRFVVGNLQDRTEIALDLFTLDGERVKKLTQTGGARPYHFVWDGRNRYGRIVEPGLYLYEVRVEAGNHVASRRGALAVAY